VFRAALLPLVIAAGGLAAVAGAGRGQRRVVLDSRTGQSGWALVFPPSHQRQPMASPSNAVAPPSSGGHPGRASASGSGVVIGYARCSTDKQDLAAQRHALRQLGVSDDRVYLDHGMTGRNRRRPGLQQALAAVRQGDTLAVPKLDRLARSVPDARAIGDSLAAGGVRLSIGGTVYDPSDPMGKMFFNILATFAEFEVDLLRMRTREVMASARANGRLKGKAPKLSARQRVHVLGPAQGGEHTIAELAELFSVSPRDDLPRDRASPPRPNLMRPRLRCQASIDRREKHQRTASTRTPKSVRWTIAERGRSDAAPAGWLHGDRVSHTKDQRTHATQESARLAAP
jgi:DNA invertase Pin-like site-specific DNA recombinase